MTLNVNGPLQLISFFQNQAEDRIKNNFNFNGRAPPSVVKMSRKTCSISRSISLHYTKSDNNCQKLISMMNCHCSCHSQALPKRPRILKLNRNRNKIHATRESLSGFVGKILSVYLMSDATKREQMLAEFDFLAPLVVMYLKKR